jgi:hypothetical protein
MLKPQKFNNGPSFRIGKKEMDTEIHNTNSVFRNGLFFPAENQEGTRKFNNALFHT